MIYMIPMIIGYCNNFAEHHSLRWIDHVDVIEWTHFPHHWNYAREIQRSPVNSIHKGQWRRALMFSLICTWTNCRVNNGDAGDLMRHRTYYNFTVMMEHIQEIKTAHHKPIPYYMFCLMWILHSNWICINWPTGNALDNWRKLAKSEKVELYLEVFPGTTLYGNTTKAGNDNNVFNTNNVFIRMPHRFVLFVCIRIQKMIWECFADNIFLTL